jgi:hypothetical protein
MMKESGHEAVNILDSHNYGPIAPRSSSFEIRYYSPAIGMDWIW